MAVPSFAQDMFIAEDAVDDLALRNLYLPPPLALPSVPLCRYHPNLLDNPLPLLLYPPILSTASPSAFNFLHTHLAEQFSAREFRLRAATDLASPPTLVTRSERARIGLKESLQCLFSQTSGLVSVRNPTTTTTATTNNNNNNKTERIFALTTPTTNTIHTIIFVSSLRLDLARRTVLLDCAVLTLTRATKRALEGAGFFAALGSAGSAGGRRGGRGERGGGIVHIKADADEMDLWRAVLPAWVERCREWAHKADACEYYRTSAAATAATAGAGVFRAPVSSSSSEAEGGEAVCGCGKGVFPEGWDTGMGVPMWEMVKGFCVRAAIAPLFASALAEEMLPEFGELVAGMRRLGEESGEGERSGRGGRTECRSCGRSKTNDGGDLKACSKCLGVKYCSRACQRVDWKRHKKECGAKQ
ncbi:hypothetical protein NEMBOFW57_006745 [Staphylotrichum longicolle]|uniref:MYND-type domain-containing protein n=1 Tax=Staphylotrichum longicolle TaxID=669026 RepID=A0AAD4HUQ1_9PEZI|nr:hypothetical protein NEMBOFW57_006745 [Staphylotrichum longicolle]